MSVNRELPHILVLPEDDANRQIAVGFQLELDWSVQRRIQVLSPLGGWNKVLQVFESDHVGAMDRNPMRIVVLLIDFDGDVSRLANAQRNIPPRLAHRVFVLGALCEPERLRSAGLGSFEAIGSKLARDCREGTDTTWSHPHLRHNASEIDRLSEQVCPILFPAR